jgi:hypothetical protein
MLSPHLYSIRYTVSITLPCLFCPQTLTKFWYQLAMVQPPKLYLDSNVGSLKSVWDQSKQSSSSRSQGLRVFTLRTVIYYSYQHMINWEYCLRSQHYLWNSGRFSMHINSTLSQQSMHCPKCKYLRHLIRIHAYFKDNAIIYICWLTHISISKIAWTSHLQ